jgi:histone H3/H4
MNLLWIVVLIQTIFFIVQNEHLFVFMFIGLSLCINAFSKNDLVYLGLPIIIVFGIYFYIRDYKLKKEGFKKINFKKAAKSATKSVSKGASNAWDKTKDGVGQATKYVKEQAVKQYKEARKKTVKAVNDSIKQSKKTIENANKKINEFKKMVENVADDDDDEPEDVDYSYDKAKIDIPGEVYIPPDMEPLEEPPPEVQPTKAQKQAHETKISGDEYGLDSE